MKRRTFLAGAATVGAVTMIGLKPSDAGASYNDYFRTVNESLKNNGPYRPMILIDLDIMDRNISTLKKMTRDTAAYRIVVKSLPSPDLTKYVMEKAGTNRLMVFHQPFLNYISKEIPDADVLLGKPMPVKAAQHYYNNLGPDNQYKHEENLQWLIDSKERVEQYLQLAKTLSVKMRINLELDVGLHRGGLTSTAQLKSIMAVIEANPQHLQFSGFMGYDAQVAKFPPIIKSIDEAYKESQDIYISFVDYIKQYHPQYELDKLCLNGAGSPSYALAGESGIANDLSAGSCLVKPLQFDISTLDDFEPASFIATPILKKLQGTTIPGLERLQWWNKFWDPNKEQTLFIYGGKWMAEYESPTGLRGNSLFGTSTNQEFINCSNNVNVNVDDHVFLRPDQSEAVFLQFDDIITIRNKRIQDTWQTLAG